MTGSVDIAEVALAADRERLIDCIVERPLPGDRGAGGGGTNYSFDLEGWVLGRAQPVAAVELLYDGKLLWRLPADLERPDVASTHPDAPAAEACGFYGPVSALTMPPRFELELRARLVDGSLAAMGVIRGSRAQLRSGYAPRVQPLMITTLGRTGSTAVIDSLSAHPAIATYRPYRYETKIASYWIEILRSLSEPASYLRQLSHARNINDRRWWLGTLGEDQAVERQTRRTVPRPLPDTGIQEWMGSDSVEAVAGFCQRSIDDLYSEIAAYFSKPRVDYFAEKYLPRPNVPSLMWEIYPRAREIVLVRDFRDMVSSMFAFNAKHGFKLFGRDQRASDAEYIERNARSNALSLLNAWKHRSDRACLVRYEDFVLHPHDTIERMLEYLDLGSDEGVIDAMVEAAVSLEPRPTPSRAHTATLDADGRSQSEDHRTSADPRASIGRWRQDLSADLKRVCETALGPALEEFGYPT